MKRFTKSRLFTAFRRQSQDTDGERLLDSQGFSEASWSPSEVYSNSKSFRTPRVPGKSAHPGTYIQLPDRSPDVPFFPPPPANPAKSGQLSALANVQLQDAQSKPSALSVLLHPVTIFVKRHKLILACSLPLTTVLLEIPMLSFFLYTYLTLPLDPETGLRPRLSPFYSIWPFISCVGSIRLAFYQGVSVIGCILTLTAGSISLYWARDVHPGYYLRRFQFFETVMANAFLIALIFASEHVSSDVHLVFVALRLLSLYGIKSTTWLTWKAMRNTYPGLIHDYANAASYYWKIGFMSLAFPFAFLANIGVWSCRSPDLIQTKGTTCYALIGAAAIGDWLYAVVNVVFLINMAYDLYHADHYGRAREGEILTASSLPTGQLRLRPRHIA